VATVAFIAERTAVRVISGMTGSTVGINIMKSRGCVTLLTSDIGVRAD